MPFGGEGTSLRGAKGFSSRDFLTKRIIGIGGDIALPVALAGEPAFRGVGVVLVCTLAGRCCVAFHLGDAASTGNIIKVIGGLLA